MISTSMVVDWLGWAGAVCVLLPYGLVSTGRLTGTSRTFVILNIAGGVFLFVNTWYHQAYPSAVVNVIWTAIGLYAIGRNAQGGVTKL
jgi:hypothetical protein